MFDDEASFWLDGTLHQTWSRVGVQPRVDTFGMRKTAHVVGALSLEERPRFCYEFASVFNGKTFLAFLRLIVRWSRRKIFLVIDNSPCHNLDGEGREWLRTNRSRTQGVWKQTKKRTTHNTFFRTTHDRDAALTATFESFRRHPSIVAPQVARFL